MTCLWAQHVWLIAFRVTNLSDTTALDSYAKWVAELASEQKNVFVQTYDSVKKAAFRSICDCYMTKG
ncbi:hypothetical protein BK026_11910 [Alteromonas sp. V450]|nr:hypothetical protein BK026_11910 [Alteromonas sp. V450]